MPNEDIKTIEVNPLTEKVQTAREQARNILRTIKINTILQKKFYISKENDENKKTLEYLTKELTRVEYQLKKVDAEDPDAKTLTENKNKKIENLKNAIKEQEKLITEVDKYIEETLKEKDEKIAKWESGENKVDIEEVKQLTDEILRKL